MSELDLDLPAPPKAPAPAGEQAGAYRVLARKYRPQTFAELIGQEAMVRTLSNAIAAGRLAHAFILTGVRGVGKTTTARIIARGLNCIGPDGHGGPTIEPCGVCANCTAIAESRHVDVLEMDAASRTGVNDIRELTDGVRYLPVQARFKVYVLDEVHMLSTAAFNALLKTLEEPPAHVKFIFATTEIRKVPVTVLSRCQRFDLKRVEADRLIAHLDGIIAKEGLKASSAALALIARAAEGSVRDSLSLLDQAIAHGGGDVTEQVVRDMLGLADRARVFDLYEAAMRGDVPGAVTELRAQYDVGADPLVVLQDMLELTHWLTRLKLVPEAASEPLASELEVARGRSMAERLSVPQLTRNWQMILKGLGEVRAAPSPLPAAEMVLVRLAYAADLPTPGDLVRQIQDGRPAEGGGRPTNGGGGSRGATALAGQPVEAMGRSRPAAAPSTAPRASAQIVPLRPEPVLSPMPQDFDAVAKLFADRREALLHAMLTDQVVALECRPGFLALALKPRAPATLTRQLAEKLKAWTGQDWVVEARAEGAGEKPGETLGERQQQAERQLREQTLADPAVQAILNAFPGARISEIRPRGGMAAEPTEHAPLAPAPDDLGDDVDYDTLLPDFTDGEDAP
jgi:DNA polymerase-3 subunit gamma/tau